MFGEASDSPESCGDVVRGQVAPDWLPCAPDWAIRSHFVSSLASLSSILPVLSDIRTNEVDEGNSGQEQQLQQQLQQQQQQQHQQQRHSLCTTRRFSVHISCDSHSTSTSTIIIIIISNIGEKEAAGEGCVYR